MNFEIITLKKDNITDFASERNVLLTKTKSEWVLFLDSDETISEGLKKELKDLEADGRSGFYIFRKNFFLGQNVGTDKILRLARKNSGKWMRSVHETWDIKGKIGTLEYPIIHNSAKNLHEFIVKINFYTTLHAEQNLKNGKRSNFLKIIFYPPVKFFQSLLMGRGLVLSMLQSLHSFLSWSKEWNLQKN